MKGMVIIGLVLLVLGGVILFNKGFSYTSREKVLDIGPIEAHTETRKTIPMAPILGVLLLAGGAGALLVGAKRA